MGIAEQEYGDFSARLYGKAYNGRIPAVGHFELTFKCPLECMFCYCTVYTSPEHTRREVTTEQAVRILDQAADAGCLWMTFSGGDPFIRPDFMQIYNHAIARGLICTIFCSGLLATDEWIRHLQKNPPLKIELPLYGITKATYEATSGKKNTFERAVANIRKMIAAGLPIRIKSKIIDLNAHEVPALKHFVETELGVDFNPSWDLYPRLDGSKDHLAHRLNPLEVRKLEALNDGPMGCESSTANLVSDELNPKVFRCASGVNSFYVNPYGELNFCTFVRQASYDLKTGNIAHGVAQLYDHLLSMTYDDGTSCKSCAIQGSCGNCPGHAVLETGSLTGKSQYLCDENH
ncbi:MAG: radical SAM protein, partial [Deltaproteobacteria bacterium]|nr:radical SAM protein [Deltaproteobacteria bacterium]